MPTKTKAPRTKTTRPAKVTVPAKPRARKVPILRSDDIQEIVRDLGWVVAPRDVQQLLTEEDELRKQAHALGESRYQLLRQQLNLALDILRDFDEGECPQIPLATIAVLAAAVTYYSRSVDVIPDFLPHIGRLDDAAVMAMAFQLGEAGVRRYCDWKGIRPPAIQRARRLPKLS